MVSEPSGEGEGPSPDAIDRMVRRLGAHRSLPAVGERGPRALGPPSPIADESRLTREPISEVVVDPSSIYVTLELRGASRRGVDDDFRDGLPYQTALVGHGRGRP